MWIILTAIGAFLQSVRNSLQRSVGTDAGMAGATLVRFFFGAPFVWLTAIFVWVFFVPAGTHVGFSTKWAFLCALGGLMQWAATYGLLKSMASHGFALGVSFQHFALPLSSIFAYFWLGDHFGFYGWAGVALASLGVFIGSWHGTAQKDAQTPTLKKPGFSYWGLVTAFGFAISINAYRAASKGMDAPVVVSSVFTLALAISLQALVAGLVLFITQPSAFASVLRQWRQSLGAGAAGGIASMFWFCAFTLAPAPHVRALQALVETPISALIGQKAFAETISARAMASMGLILVGVALLATSLGKVG